MFCFSKCQRCSKEVQKIVRGLCRNCYYFYYKKGNFETYKELEVTHICEDCKKTWTAKHRGQYCFKGRCKTCSQRLRRKLKRKEKFCKTCNIKINNKRQSGYCKICKPPCYSQTKEYNRLARQKWRKENKEKYAEYQKTSTIKKIQQKYWASEKGLIAQRMNAEKRRSAMNGGTFSKEEYLQLLKEQKGKCFYCDQEKSLAMDHMIPLSRGGKHEIYNIVLACKSCNSKKGTRTTEEFLGY